MPVPPQASSHLHPEASMENNSPAREVDPATELVFDEADALFRKRSSVSDTHDRYSDESTAPPHKP